MDGAVSDQPEDDGLSPQLRAARAQRPTVAVFGSEEDPERIEYRLHLGQFIFDVTMVDGKVIEWYVYDRETHKIVESGGLSEPATPAPYGARNPHCVENWPECYSGGYDPRCCRFPKSCSC